MEKKTWEKLKRGRWCRMSKIVPLKEEQRRIKEKKKRRPVESEHLVQQHSKRQWWKTHRTLHTASRQKLGHQRLFTVRGSSPPATCYCGWAEQMFNPLKESPSNSQQSNSIHPQTATPSWAAQLSALLPPYLFMWTNRSGAETLTGQVSPTTLTTCQTLL